MKRIKKLLSYLPFLVISIIVLFLLYDFTKIKDVSLTTNSGNYVIISSNQKQSNLIGEMKKSEDEIAKILKENSINSKISSVFYPDLPSFVYYKNSERRKPYDIKVASDEFFKSIKINQPELNVLYRMKGEYDGNTKIRFNTSDTSENFKKDDFKLYDVESKPIIEKSVLPSFDDEFNYMKFGDYITLDTFSSIIETVYGKNIVNYEYGEFSSFYIFIKSEDGSMSNSIIDILPEKYHAITDNEVDSENVFDGWRQRLKLGIILILMMFVLEIVMIKKKNHINKSSI